MLMLFLLVVAVYAFYLEPRSLRVVEHRVTLDPPLGDSGNPLTIAVIADLQAGSPYIDEAKIGRVVELTNAASPDLILLPGDFVIQGVLGGSHIAIEIIAEKLSRLSAPLGVYAALGNHDHWEDTEHIARVLEQIGIPVLENRSVTIGSGKAPLYLVGISDATTTNPDLRRAFADISKDAPVLCISHSPDIFPDLPSTCRLTITGHTHGGQVWLPFLGRPIVPSRYGQRYAAGLIRESGKTLFVSTGIGTSIIPVRFLVPPEISILKIE